VHASEFKYLFNLLYSVYSLPNIAIPFLGGLFIVKMGYRQMFIAFGFLILVGQLIFSLCCSFKSIYGMIFGRFIFGLGGEAINATQATLIVNWFDTNELSFALGLALSFLRFGGVLNDIISPRLATMYNDVSISLWIGFAICSVSFLIILLVVYLDWREEVLMKMHFTSNSNSEKSNENEIVSLKLMKNFPKILYLLALLCALLYSGVFPFNYIATGFLIKTYLHKLPAVEAQHQAGFFMSFPFLLSAFLIPFLGIYVDKYGKRTYLLIVCCLIGILTYIFFIYSNPIIPLLMLGLSYSIYASIIWPALTLIIGTELTGLAIGFTCSLQNFGLVICPLVVAYIYTVSASYYFAMGFFIIVYSISLIFAIIIHFENIKMNNFLNISEKESKMNQIKKDHKYENINNNEEFINSQKNAKD